MANTIRRMRALVVAWILTKEKSRQMPVLFFRTKFEKMKGTEVLWCGMEKQEISPAFKEATKAIDKIKAVIPKLTESEKATIELLLDEESRNHLAESIKDAKKGNTVSWEDAMKELEK